MSKNANIQAIRGMKDLLPEHSSKWLDLETKISTLLQSYGYDQVRMPLVEKTEVFHRAIGKVTDIVEKEMYSWQDNNGDNLSLRPEATASCVRLMIEHNLVRERAQKVWYIGAMFRRERPQKGRYRQFHQIGGEIFGLADAKVDAELIEITHQLWQALKLNVRLEINSLGSTQARLKYKTILVEYFSKHSDELDKDSLRRLKENPLRILDSKNPDLKTLIENAPKITQHLDEQSQQHFDQLQSYLTHLDIPYIINPNLVRGLDYYNQTVFEWISEDLGSQGTICAGGRYDGLFEQMGGKPTPAAGFAIGLERLILLLADKMDFVQKKSIYLITQGDDAQQYSFTLANTLRQAIPELIVYNNCAVSSLKSQFKKADKLQVDFAVILAQDEMDQGLISLKSLKDSSGQTQKNQDDLIKFLKQYY